MLINPITASENKLLVARSCPAAVSLVASGGDSSGWCLYSVCSRPLHMRSWLIAEDLGEIDSDRAFGSGVPGLPAALRGFKMWKVLCKHLV